VGAAHRIPGGARRAEELSAHPPDLVVATTGIGLRGWIAAADGWGIATELTTALGTARIVSRGPKATGALRAAGLPEEWSPVTARPLVRLGVRTALGDKHIVSTVVKRGYRLTVDETFPVGAA